jgi:hypothetical protein
VCQLLKERRPGMAVMLIGSALDCVAESRAVLESMQVARARELLAASNPRGNPDNAGGPDEPPANLHSCPCCGGRMIIIEVFERGCEPRYRPSATTLAIRLDTS